jgi:ATP-dependent Lhr-like helicase
MHAQLPGRDVFKLLAKPVQQGLGEVGFAEPTLPQSLAIPPILSGENVLLIAPTGSGKTEAVLLPIFSKLVQGERTRGISVLYVTPLRALNRDMLRRLGFWAQQLDVSIEVRPVTRI